MCRSVSATSLDGNESQCVIVPASPNARCNDGASAITHRRSLVRGVSMSGTGGSATDTPYPSLDNNGSFPTMLPLSRTLPHHPASFGNSASIAAPSGAAVK